MTWLLFGGIALGAGALVDLLAKSLSSGDDGSCNHRWETIERNQLNIMAANRDWEFPYRRDIRIQQRCTRCGKETVETHIGKTIDDDQ